MSIAAFQAVDQASIPSQCSGLTLGVSLVTQRIKRLVTKQETWVQSMGQEDPLEKGMATLSSILAGIIPQTEESGRLQSMGSQRYIYIYILYISSPMIILQV